MSTENKEKKPRSKKRLIGDILIIALTAFLAIVVIRMVICKSKGEPYFLFNKYSVTWVLSGSMEPTIPTQSFILVERVSGEEVKEGDVIMFHSLDPKLQGKLNTHRVLDFTEDDAGNTVIVTKGDHNIVKDEYTVPFENVRGRYVTNLSIISFIGRLFVSKSGFLYIFIAILMMAVVTVWNYVRAFKEKRQPQEDSEEAKQAELNEMIQQEIERLKASGLTMDDILSAASAAGNPSSENQNK